MSIGHEAFYGGAYDFDIAVDTFIFPIMGRVQVINATASGKKVKLPDATTLKKGGPIFYIYNDGANSFEVTDNAGGSLSPAINLATNEVGTVCLVDNSTAAGEWKVIVESSSGITPPVFIRRVYIFGGDGTSANTKRIYEFDTVDDSWAQKTSSTEDHKNGTGFGIGNRGYAVGSSLGATHKKTEEYYGDAWIAKTDANLGPCDGTTILGKGYLQQEAGSRYVDEYDRSTDVWTQKGSATPASVEAFGGILGDAYGSYGTGSITTTYKYTPSTDTWADMSSAAPAPTRSFSSGDATESTGLFYQGMGYSTTYIDDVEEYTKATNAWASKADYPPGDRWKASLVPANDKIYIQQGASGGGNQDDCQELTPGTNNWSAKTDVPITNTLMMWSGWNLIP